MTRAILVAVLALGAASVAYSLPDCSAVTSDAAATLTPGTPDAASCVKGTIAKEVTVKVSSAQAEDGGVRIIVWNHDLAAGWGATAPTTNGGAMSTVAGLLAAGGTTDTVAFYKDVDCAGDHKVNVAETTKGWSAVAVRVANLDDGMPNVDAATANAAKTYFRSVADMTAQYRLGLKNVPTMAAKLSASISGCGIGSIALDNMNSASDSTTDSTTEFVDVDQIGAHNAGLLFRCASLSAAFYDLKANGPFASVTATLVSVSAFTTVEKDTEVSVTPDETTQMFIYRRSATSRKTTIMTKKGGETFGNGKVSDMTVSFDAADVATNGINSGTFGTDLDNEAAQYAIADPSDWDSLKLLSGATASADLVYIKVPSKGAGAASVCEEAFSFKVTEEEMDGECAGGYPDCFRKGDEHPSSKVATSANGDALRMKHCMVVPSSSDPTVSTTKCTECLSDCECGPGQYCHKDAGVCNANNGNGPFYNCDPDGNRKLGLCMAKDPTGDIIGQSCRTGSAQPASNAARGRKVATTTNDAYNLALVSEGTERSVEVGSVLSASGFCGGLRFYNNTPPAGAAALGSNTAGASGTVRQILWEGACVNHVCQECDAGDTMCGGNGRALVCVNGRWEENIYVDQTARTFNDNTVAGTSLAVVFMLIVVQLCICVRVVQSKTDDAAPSVAK